MQYSQLLAAADDSNHDMVKDVTKESSPQRTCWGSPLEMLLLFTGGTISAIAHQLYYHFLDGKPVSSTHISQEWVIRIGTGQAFLAKTCWKVAILIARAQQVWVTMDQKHLSLKTIDAMFTAATDFTSFRRWEMVSHAKIATLLALVAWFLPLSAIVTPSTLTVIPLSRPNARTLTAEVPLVDFRNATRFAALSTYGLDECPVTSDPKRQLSAVPLSQRADRGADGSDVFKRPHSVHGANVSELNL